MSSDSADLFEKFEEIWLTSFFDYLPISESIDVERLNGNLLPRGDRLPRGMCLSNTPSP
jgi:hypothetical protein